MVNFHTLFLNVYAPTKRNEKEIFYRKLCKWIQNVKHINDSLVLGGDWNCVQNASIDTRGMSYTYKQVEWFRKMQNDLICLIFGENFSHLESNTLGVN